MTTWHRLGDRTELMSRVPCSLKLDRWSVAVFFYDGKFRAIGNSCNHKGGPLCEGRLRGEFVMCPWHAWEYSVISGKGPEGYDEEQVPLCAGEEHADGLSAQTPPAMPRKLVKHMPSHLLEEPPKTARAAPRVLCVSTTAMDDVNPRYSTSDALLEHALDQAKRRNADTQYVKLRDLKFRHCEGNYSKASHACTWPCAITERDPDDQLTIVYEGLVHWADVVLIATPIRWGNASSLYYKMIERLNCVQNQITIHDKVLIRNKVAAFIITGGQDNIQAVAGGMLTFWSSSASCSPPSRSSPIRAAGTPRTCRTTSARCARASRCARRPTSCWIAPSTSGPSSTSTRPKWTSPWSAPGVKRTPSRSPRRSRSSRYERAHAGREGVREGAVRRQDGRGGELLHGRHRLLGGRRAADRRRVEGAHRRHPLL